jgi:predicted glycogen debranching enzyme
LWLLAPGATIEPRHDWYRGFALALERERGLEPNQDLLCAAELRTELSPGDTFTLIASTRHDAGARGGRLGLATALARRHAHEKSLMAMWTAAHPRASRAAPPWIEQLVLAADAFVVERATAGDPNGRSVVAGYPWFADWGRDTMIALPGLALATGRPEIARAVIATFARHLDQGMLPNRFPDHGHAPEYTSADAALWFFQAVRATFEATGDEAWLAALYPALEEVGAWMETGTRYGIGIDPSDGLVRIGETDRLALTWMDARVDGRAVTPRRGKPVEINALWHGALVAMAGFATRLKRPAEPYELLARRVERSFERFWNAEAGGLYDVIDTPDGADASIRPNQLLAVALPESPLPPLRRRTVLETCGRLLLTSHGMRSLAPDDPRYRSHYLGPPAERDRAYHQGTAWTWLLPVHALAHFRVHGDRDAALALLEPFGQLIGEYGVGSLPEIADGGPPHLPRGCFAQAWSVGEALRVWHLLAAPRTPAAQAGVRPNVEARERIRSR